MTGPMGRRVEAWPRLDLPGWGIFLDADRVFSRFPA